jgi:hypothetical protein
MFSLRSLVAASSILVATLAAPLCGAQTVEVVTAGSSAQWGVFAEAALALAQAGSPTHTAFHYTLKGNCTGTGSSAPCAFLQDNRGAGIPKETGSLWVVWNENSSGVPNQIWAYLSVDSVVGVRSFEAFPRSTLQIDSGFASAPASQIDLLDFAVSTGTGAVFPDADTVLPGGTSSGTVYAALNGAALTAANTDIRPEDALFATTRALATLDPTTLDGLGYTTATSAKDQFGGAAFVQQFALFGSDPISSQTIPAANLYQTVPVGAAPIVFVGNTSNTASGHIGNTSITNLKVATSTVTSNDAEALFSGTNCTSEMLGFATATVNVNPILREPTSGTMNTTEFTNFRLTAAPNGSQEAGVGDPTVAANNPLTAKPCTTGGARSRGIGTGNEVKAIKLAADNLGYLFFSYEAAPPKTISGTPATIAYKYLKLDNVDPINQTYGAGTLPTCNSATLYNCSASKNGSGVFTSYPHLRDGTYRSWSVYRVITDSNGSNKSNAQTLVNVANAVADAVLPDFVPLYPVCSGSTYPSGVTLLGNTTYQGTEPGLQVYRQHFTPSGVVLPTTHPPYNPLSGGVEIANDGPNLGTTATCTAGTFHSGYLGGMDSLATNSEVGGDVGGAIVITPSGTTATPPGATGTRQ